MVTKNTKAAAAEAPVKETKAPAKSPAKSDKVDRAKEAAEASAPAAPAKTKKVKEAPAPAPEVEVEGADEGGEADESSVVTRKDLAEAIRTLMREDKGLAVTEKVAVAMVYALEESIVAAVSQGFNVSLPGFGKFNIGLRAGGPRRNPATGETITVEDSFGVTFKVGASLKKAAKALVVA